MYMDGDTVCTPFELEAFRDGVKYVRKLVEEDLLYVGSFTQDLAALTQIAESDRLGACSGGYILFCNLGSDIYRNYRRVLPVRQCGRQRLHHLREVPVPRGGL